MIDRRFGPLVVILGVGFSFVMLRAAGITITEHDIWEIEAANLDRTSRRLPYHRGRIFARSGEVLVEDEERYLVSFEWREFRRENPIGQVGMASSTWTGEPVILSSDPRELGQRAVELLELSPLNLTRFAEGERERAADMAFYLRRIVGLKGRADGRLRQLMSERDEPRSVLTLAALACDEVRSNLRGEDAITEHVSSRCEAALEDLVQLELSLGLDPGSLLGLLEGYGDEVADAVASRLFRSAAGFSAGRLEPDTLAGWDLSWLRKTLRWGEEREAAWRERARDEWQAFMLTRIAPGAALEARFEGPESDHDELLRTLAPTFALVESQHRTVLEPWAGESLRDSTDLFELDEEPLRFREEPLFVAIQRSGSPPEWSPTQELFEEPMTLTDLGDWEEVWIAAGLERWEPPTSAAEAFTRWSRRRPSEDVRLSQWVLIRWALEWQWGWEQYQAGISAEGAPSLDSERVEKALDERDTILVMQGRRAWPIEEAPDYEVVYLLTRYPERFRGFHIETRTRRTWRDRALSEEDPLWRVVGGARRTNLEEVLVNVSRFEDLTKLRRRALRSDSDELELRRLVEFLPRHDELHGADGVELLMDQRLSGRNGYLEYESLAELMRRGGTPVHDWRPVHGEDVELTIDLALQQAASETINHPTPTPTGRRTRDDAWFDSPTGAICLITPEGEVLAAASAPNQPRAAPIPHRDGQGAFAHERTLRRHTALPIGSVFKPLVALWCLEHDLVTSEEALACVRRERRGALYPGFDFVDCHSSVGHGHLHLAEALRVSCNAYFAQLGARLESGEGLQDCAQTFGFDRSTGVNDSLGESAIREDYENPSFRRAAEFGDMELELGANGLMVLEGTPLQVARAYAGLATGELPSLSFVRGEGAAPVPLSFSERNLHEVQSALRQVARSGSARVLKDLDVAAKTGSADYAKMKEEVLAQLYVSSGRTPGQRKHTWVAGWTPAEDPRLIFVVYLHDIGVTSGDSAVFVARELLERPEIRAYLSGSGS